MKKDSQETRSATVTPTEPIHEEESVELDDAAEDSDHDNDLEVR
jgi:hypothetical protein